MDRVPALTYSDCVNGPEGDIVAAQSGDHTAAHGPSTSMRIDLRFDHSALSAGSASREQGNS